MRVKRNVRLAPTFGRGLLDREVHAVKPYPSGLTLCGQSTGYDYPCQSTADRVTCAKCKRIRDER